MRHIALEERQDLENQMRNQTNKSSYIPEWLCTSNDEGFISDLEDDNGLTKKICIIMSIGMLLLVIMLPLSFQYVQYNEMAFDRNKFGTVDTSHVIGQGRHFVQLTHELIRFPTTYTEIAFMKNTGSALTIFTNDGYQISIEILFYYRLKPEKLKQIYDKYSMNWHMGIVSQSKLLIRDLSGSKTSGVYLPLQSYISNRSYVQERYAEEISNQLYNYIGVEAPTELFKIIELDIPQDMIDQYLRTVIQLQDNEIQENRQQVVQIMAETDRLVSVINAQTNATIENSKIKSNYIKTNAKSIADGVILQAQNTAMYDMSKRLNISNENMALFSQTINMLNNPNAKTTYVGFKGQPVIVDL